MARHHRTKNLQHLLNSTALSAATLSCTLLAGTTAMAAVPTTGDFTNTAGSASYATVGTTQGRVTQTTNRAVNDWTNFNTTSGSDTMIFIMPGNDAISFNRISGSATNFQGRLFSRIGTASGAVGGQVWLSNANGFNFNGAQINVGGLLATTADITNATTSGFMTNATDTFNFDVPGALNAKITITNTPSFQALNPSASSRYVGLFAPAVEVLGSSTAIRAQGGTIGIGAGGDQYSVNIDPDGDGLISFAVSDPITSHTLSTAVQVNGAEIDVSGTSGIAGGNIYITVEDMNGVFDSLINLPTSSNIRASGGANADGGQIIFTANTEDNAGLQNAINVGPQSNLIADAGSGASATGGSIQLLASAESSNASSPLINIDGQSVLSAIPSPRNGEPDPDDGEIVITAERDGVLSDDDIVIGGKPGNQYNRGESGQAIIRPCPVVNGVIVDCATQPPTVEPTPQPTPEPTPEPTPAPSVGFIENQSNFDPLNQPVKSWRDADVKDLEFTSFDPYFDNRANTNLSLSGNGVNTSATGATSGSLGDLSPAAGGELGELSPAAGGLSVGETNINCANAYLDSEFNLAPEARNCIAEQTDSLQ